MCESTRYSACTMAFSLLSLVTALPMLGMDIALIALAVSRWQKHPRVSMFAAGAGVLRVAIEIGARGAYLVLANSFSSSDVSTYYTLISGFSSLVGMVATGLLIAAIFSDRGPSTDVR